MYKTVLIHCFFVVVVLFCYLKAGLHAAIVCPILKKVYGDATD